MLKETSNVLSNEYIRKEDIVECDNCGCLIWKNKAIQKKFVEERVISGVIPIPVNGDITEEVCITKYFCKKCGVKYKKKI